MHNEKNIYYILYVLSEGSVFYTDFISIHNKELKGLQSVTAISLTRFKVLPAAVPISSFTCRFNLSHDIAKTINKF
jgi:hypothetical protein